MAASFGFGRGLTSKLFVLALGVFIITQILQIIQLTKGCPHANSKTLCQALLDSPRTASKPAVAEPLASPSTSLPEPSHCFYRKFPEPEPHEGLPFLTDAFADHTVEHAVLLTMNRQEVFARFTESDTALGSDPETGRTHHYLCMFQGTIPVWSEAMHRPGFVDNSRPKAHLRTSAIRCKIPEELRHLIQQGQRETHLHVDLVALIHPTNHSRFQVEKSQLVADLPTIPNIPICHPLSNAADDISTTLKPNQFKFMMHTEIMTSYFNQHSDGVATEAAFRIHEWIHYHHYQGADHFVIYDNDPQDHGPLEAMLAPYVKQGLVTRVWDPFAKQHKENDPKQNKKPLSQGQKGTSTLWRYGYTTRLFGNTDMDEYFIPMDSKRTVRDIMEAKLEKQPDLDGSLWYPYVVTYCNGTILPKSELNGGGGGTSMYTLNRKTEMGAKRCRTTSRAKGSKMMFVANRMWFWNIHTPFLTDRQTKPKMWKVPESVGFLGHYRRGAFETIPVNGDKNDKIMILHDIEHENPSMAMLDPYLNARDKEQELLKKKAN